MEYIAKYFIWPLIIIIYIIFNAWFLLICNVLIFLWNPANGLCRIPWSSLFCEDQTWIKNPRSDENPVITFKRLMKFDFFI